MSVAQGELNSFPIWTVYDRPPEYPHCFVARRSDLYPYGAVRTEEVVVRLDLGSLRQALEERGLYRIDRDEGDDPEVLETWF